MDDVITTTYDGLSIVDITTLPPTHEYTSSPNEHFDGYTDSDDDSDYDDLPDLMDPPSSDDSCAYYAVRFESHPFR